MRKDDPLAEKESISPEDLWDLPLIISQEQSDGGELIPWMRRNLSSLNIAAAYNLLFNASLLVEEGVGYAICFDNIINTSGNSNLCFRPLNPSLEVGMSVIWKKYQLFSKPAEKFIQALRASLKEE